jgi:hypothetical protein
MENPEEYTPEEQLLKNGNNKEEKYVNLQVY